MTVEPTPLSSNNQRLSDLRRLTGRRKSRLDAGRFVIEGPVPVAELLAAGAPIDEVFVDLEQWRAADESAVLRAVVRDADAAGTPVWGLDAGVLASIADTDAPQGVLATAPRRTSTLDQLASLGGGPVLVLVDVNDPGNAGTLVRTAEAAGARAVLAVGSTTDLFGPKAVRAAAGSVVRLPIVEQADPVAALDGLRSAGCRIIGTVVAGGAAPDAVDLRGPVAILVGSEAHGLSDAVVERCDDLVTIPMAERVESVNAAIAGAIVLFDAARQRRSPVDGR